MGQPRDSTGHPLHGARLKADFAVTRLDSLNADTGVFLTMRRPRIESTPHTDRRGADLRIRLTANPPDEWALRIGEVVHHLRSALDHVAWQLAAAPNKQTAFPPVNTANQFHRAATALGFSPDIIARFEAIRSAEVLDPPVNPLAMLEALWGLDKHRLLPLTLLAVREADVEPVVRNATIERLEIKPPRELKDAAKLGSIRLRRDNFDVPWELELTYNYQLLFADARDAGGGPLPSNGRRVIEALREAAIAVHNTVGEAQSVFSEPHFWDRL
jgi:hypothetical protein